MSLFVLPFDHRATFAKELLGLPYPRITATQKKIVSNYKQIVWEGFLKARAKNSSLDPAILVDEEFGAAILKDAKRRHIPFALSTEKSGQAIFDFEYGKTFGAHIKKWKPAYAKALVRYNVADTENNRVQNARLKILSDFCKKQGLGLMLEILLQGGSRIENVMREMLAAGITPAVWKIEGLETATRWKKVLALTSARLIVLGRGDTKKHVERWLTVAAQSGVVSGFAVGRTVFLKPLQDFRDEKIARADAVRTIAANYLHFINLWHKSASHP